MKRLLFIAIVCIWGVSSAQIPNVLYQQDFENYSSGDMIMVDNDHLTPHYSGYDTWVVKNGVAVSTSYYDDGDKTADDWMITPTIQLGSHPMVLWKAYTPDASYRDGYQVLVSTDTANPEDLTLYQPVFSVAEENTSWTYHVVDLSNYANKAVRLAWRNNSTDKFFLYVDDIFVYDAQAYDLWVMSSDVPAFVKNNQKVLFSINVLNIGYNPVNQVTMEYAVMGSGDTITEAKTFSSTISPGDLVNLQTDSLVFTNDGLHTARLNTSLPGNADLYNDNDTVVSQFSVWTEGVTNRVLIEHFTQASCGPCAQQNPRLNNLVSQNKYKVSHIAYHTWWPGTDPMYDYNPQPVKARVNYYGVSGVPTVVVNGNYYNGAPDGITQKMVDDLFGQNGLAKINVWHQRTADSLLFNIRIIPVADFPVPVRLFAVWVEDKKYSSPPGSNGEKEFPDVMRQMLPDGNGYLLDSLKKDDTVFVNLACKNDPDINYNKSSLVVFLQNYDTKEVYVTYEKDFSDNTAVNDPVAQFSVYPNPAHDKIFVGIDKIAYRTHVEIIDQQGRVVKNLVINQDGQLSINVQDLNPGIYVIRITGNNEVKTAKFVKY